MIVDRLIRLRVGENDYWYSSIRRLSAATGVSMFKLNKYLYNADHLKKLNCNVYVEWVDAEECRNVRIGEIDEYSL